MYIYAAIIALEAHAKGTSYPEVPATRNSFKELQYAQCMSDAVRADSNALMVLLYSFAGER